MRPLRWVLLACALVGCGSQPSNTVTVYVSEDRVFSEPILKDFEKETGIRVQAVFDTEEFRSVNWARGKQTKSAPLTVRFESP